MLQVFKTVLLFVIIILSIIAAQGTVCTNLSKNRVSFIDALQLILFVINFQNMCSNSKWQSDIIITNESSTSVLVQWKHYIMNNGLSTNDNGSQGGLTKRQSENEVIYNITYNRTGSNDASVSYYNFN